MDLTHPLTCSQRIQNNGLPKWSICFLSLSSSLSSTIISIFSSTTAIKYCLFLSCVITLLRPSPLLDFRWMTFRKIYSYDFIPWDFSTPELAGCFHWNLSDSYSFQVSRTLLSILVDIDNAVVWIIWILSQISSCSCLYPDLLRNRSQNSNWYHHHPHYSVCLFHFNYLFTLGVF